MTWQAPETEEAWAECLSAYVDGEMSPDDKTELENILKSNPKRATQLEDLKKTSILLRKWNIEAPVPEADFIREVRKQYEPARRPLLFARWSVWPLAASAVLAFFLVLFWHGGSQSDISWADVLKHLEQVHTVTGILRTDLSTKDGNSVSLRSKVFSKDPGLTRNEQQLINSTKDHEGQETESVAIARGTSERIEILTLFPNSKRAQLDILSADVSETQLSHFVNFVADTRRLIKSIAADKTKYIGDRLLEGRSVMAFEAEVPVQDLPGTVEKSTGNSRIQIWIDRSDAIPVYYKCEYDDDQGEHISFELSDIQWNIPLDDSLFDFTVPDGWELYRTRGSSGPLNKNPAIR